MLNESTARDSGAVIAELLKHSWRERVAATVAPERVEDYVRLLTNLGVAGLVAQKVVAGESEPVSLLTHVYRQNAIAAMQHQHSVCDIFKRARASRIEPILFKGWGLARLYSDVALRPYGDIDLWVRPDELQRLYDLLPPDNQYCVEPHASFYREYERSFDEILENSQLVPLGDVSIRLPAAEDHLRFLCLHFLHHGGWRPLWLCDIALMVEVRASTFDWDRCLRGSEKYADWIACVIGLAHKLLGADISGTPAGKRAQRLPAWLSDAVLRQWGSGSGMSVAEQLSFSLPRRVFRPAQLRGALSEHWRNPIQASVEMGARFNELPRQLFQVGAAFLRVPEFVRTLRSGVRTF